MNDRKTVILIAIFVAALVAANLLGSKITTLFGVSVSVGIFAYPLTFLITDIIEEVYGAEKSRHLITAGFVTLVFLFLLVFISRALPPAQRFADHSESYNTIFGNSLRIIIASLIAFVISQYHDVWAFAKLKQQTHGKYLWLRNNVSTWLSQLIDTVLFMFIAFYQVTPRYDTSFLISLIVPYWLFKILFAAIDTPLVYAGVAWLKKK